MLSRDADKASLAAGLRGGTTPGPSSPGDFKITPHALRVSELVVTSY